MAIETNAGELMKPEKRSCIKLNSIYNENCLDTMAKMPDNFIDMTVTSPPYDEVDPIVRTG